MQHNKHARALLLIGAMSFGTLSLALPALAETMPNPSPDNQPAQGDYPRASMEVKEAGDAVIAVLVKADGKIGDAKVKTSSGSARLDNAAIRMIKNRFHFTPGTKDGMPADVWVVQPISFKAEVSVSSDPKCAQQKGLCDTGDDRSYSITIGTPDLLNP